jgi:hypothetical protein
VAFDTQDMDKNRSKALMATIDALAAISVAYAFIGFPLWLNYHTIVHGTVARRPPEQLWLMIAGISPCMFGLPWLIRRYAASISRKYPITTDLRFRLLFVLAMPVLMFIAIVVRVWR